LIADWATDPLLPRAGDSAGRYRKTLCAYVSERFLISTAFIAQKSGSFLALRENDRVVSGIGVFPYLTDAAPDLPFAYREALSLVEA